MSPQPLSRSPYNAETPPEALVSDATPVDALFVRNHHAMPAVDPATWRLEVDGAVAHPLRLRLADLRGRPHRTLEVVLECAGNGRSGLVPRPSGLAWGQGAVGCVRVSGVPLATLLEEAGLRSRVQAIIGIGADGEAEGPEGFQRALPRAVALHPDTLLVTRMNGRPLTLEHGGPVRLLVPGWYGMAHLKWITRLTAVREPFEGKWQTKQYVYRAHEPGGPSRPVERIRVRSVIVAPVDGASLRVGRRARLTGRAWSDCGITRVRASVDGGATWNDARLGPVRGPYAWRSWSFAWTPTSAGPLKILARATDGRGCSQPLVPQWNELGYGNNAVALRRARAVAARPASRSRAPWLRARRLTRAVARPRGA